MEPVSGSEAGGVLTAGHSVYLTHLDHRVAPALWRERWAALVVNSFWSLHVSYGV